MSEKWWDMSDDELDDLFRDASEKVEVPFDSSSFDKLRHKMDSQRQPEISKGFKEKWLLLLAGLIILVGVGLMYHFNSKKDNIRRTNSTEMAGNIDNKNAAVSSKIIPKEVIDNKSALSKPENLSKQKNKAVEKLNPLLPVDKQINNKATIEKTELSSVNTIGIPSQTMEAQKTKRKRTSENSKSLLSLKIPKKANLERSSVEKSETDNQTTAGKINKLLIAKSPSKNRNDKRNNNYSSKSIVLRQIRLPITESLPIVQEKTLFEETVISKMDFYYVNTLKNKDLKSFLTNMRTELPNYVDSLPRMIKPIKFSKFGIRLAVSPDFNSIENLGTSALGGTVGILFEYKLSKKLILQTGITYSNKKYVGGFDDYHNWTDWKGYHPSKPTEVDGGCKIIDIPINLRVNLFQKPKQTWFVSSGISSYLMTKESYTYIYNWAPSKTSNWNDNSKYYWGVLNFSVGFDRQISKHFSLQVEPYLKTPLKSVGRGGINLYSSGLLFSTKYEF